MKPDPTEHPFNRTPSQLIRAHTAIKECLHNRDYHSLRRWATNAEEMELSLNEDVAISNNKGCIGYIFDGEYHRRIYEEDII